MLGYADKMRLIKYISCILWAVMTISASFSHADVITTPDKGDNNYNLHYRIVVQNAPQNSQNIKSGLTETISTYSTDSLLSKNISGSQDITAADSFSFTRFSAEQTRLKAPFVNDQLLQGNLGNGTNPNADFVDMSVGAFLDDLKDDPTLRTIYFTSKDLTFSYRKRVANLLKLGIEMEDGEEENIQHPWRADREIAEQLTEQEKKILKRETGLLFGLISESYKNIFLVLLTMIGALYLSFHYILNKYI